MKRSSIPRVLGSIFLTGAGLLCFWIGSYQITFRWDALKHEAVNSPVNLSKTGVTRFEFRSRFRTSHGKQFRVVLDPPLESAREIEKAFRDFEATFIFLSVSGDELFRRELSLKDFLEDPSPGCRDHEVLKPNTPYVVVPRSRGEEWPKTLVLEVKKAANLEGIRNQRLVSKNVLCSTGKIGSFIGGGLCLIGLVLIFFGAKLVTLLWKAFYQKHRN